MDLSYISILNKFDADLFVTFVTLEASDGRLLDPFGLVVAFCTDVYQLASIVKLTFPFSFYIIHLVNTKLYGGW